MTQLYDREVHHGWKDQNTNPFQGQYSICYTSFSIRFFISWLVIKWLYLCICWTKSFTSTIGGLSGQILDKLNENP